MRNKLSRIIIDTNDGPILAINVSNRAMGEPDCWEMSFDDQDGPESVFDHYFFSDVLNMIREEIAPLA